jgi:hypothetical protein
MFEAIPTADAYTLKMILHDWNDDECVAILSNIRRAAPRNARVFVIEHVVPGPETPHLAKLFDLHMMCWGRGGRGWRTSTSRFSTRRGGSSRRHGIRAIALWESLRGARPKVRLR